MADVPFYEGDDDIIEHYENQESDNERGSHEEGEDATSDNETGTARRIDPSKSKSKSHVVRNPAPKLNTERLKGPSGIQTIENYFEGFKFYGKGHERTDLERIMKRLEHWSYRLFPKYHFDDFLARVEQLGTKKDLQVFIKKYRLDMLTSDSDLIIHDNMDKDDEDQQESAPLDDFDLLITEQIQKQKQAEVQAVTSSEDMFDKLLMQSDTQSGTQTDIQSGTQSDIQSSTQSNIQSGMQSDIQSGMQSDIQSGMQNTQVPHTNTTIANELSDEVKQRIERNKQLAIQRRLQRQKKQEEEVKRKKLIDDTNSEVLNETDNLTVHDGTNTSQVDNTRSQINENVNEAIVNESNEEAIAGHE